MKKLLFSIAAICMIALGSMSAFSQSQNRNGGAGGGGSTATTYINSFKVTAGYPPKGLPNGAVWVNYRMNSVATLSGMGYTIYIDLYRMDTGQLMYHFNPNMAQGTIDFDSVPLNTMYHVDFTVVDNSTGQILERASGEAATPKPRQGVV